MREAPGPWFHRAAHERNPNILLGVCGSIAAVKALDLARRLRELPAAVRATMTPRRQEDDRPGDKLHQVKDRSLREDQERSGPAAVTLSRLRSLAVGLLGRLPGDHAPAKFQAVLANDSLASDLIANPLPQR